MKNNDKKTLTKDLIIVKKHINIKIFYMLIIILGAIFISLSCFHSNLWFDESYSVAITNHSFKDIWIIGSNDVHPILYYFILKIAKIFINDSILVSRLLSIIPLIIMAILGYTHIRKDFGEKTGLIFTFLTLFMPVCVIYAGEIRMYTWAMLFVTIMTIYAYRIYRNDSLVKNWIILTIFSLASAYTHYYGLITAFVVNMYLFIYLLVNTLKTKKYTTKHANYFKSLKKCIMSIALDIIIYLPWLGAFIVQAKNVSNGFWISKPDYAEMLEFIITGNLREVIHLYKFISIPVTIITIGYFIYLFIKNRKNEKIVKIALLIYFTVVAIIRIISMKQPILYARYLLNLEGILFLVMAILMSKDNMKNIIAICSIIFISSTIININLIKDNYDKSNQEPVTYVKSNIEEDDIVLISNDGSGFVIDAELNIDYSKTYFWDRKNWNVEEAYKAYGKTIYNLDELKDFKGRIWVISYENSELPEAVSKELSGCNIKEKEYYKTKYKNSEYGIALIERN